MYAASDREKALQARQRLHRDLVSYANANGCSIESPPGEAILRMSCPLDSDMPARLRDDGWIVHGPVERIQRINPHGTVEQLTLNRAGDGVAITEGSTAPVMRRPTHAAIEVREIWEIAMPRSKPPAVAKREVDIPWPKRRR